MAQRGGSVLSHLKVGGFAGPLVAMGRADLLLSLEPGEAVRNLGFLAPGAALVVNAADGEFLSPEARRSLSRRKVRVLFTDAAQAAQDAGDPRGANLALLALAAKAGMLPVSAAGLKAAVLRQTSEARRESNERQLSLASSPAGTSARRQC